MKKKEISTLDLNAKTLNNQPASYYDVASIGLRNIPLNIPEDNLDRAVTTGLFEIKNTATDTPAPGLIGLLLVLHRNPNNIIQMAFYFLWPTQVFVRAKRTGGWSEWSSIV